MSSLTLEETLSAALQALCPRVYPDVAPTGVAEPYVVWHLYGGQAPSYTEGALPNQRNAYVQINVWHPSRATCNTLSLQIEAALAAHPVLQAQPLNAIMATFDEDTERRGAMQDFSIWAPR